MNWVSELIAKTRRAGLLIDTNILLLHLIGRFAPARIGSWKRIEQFTVEDFRLLSALIGRFERLITTPHILTEVGNFAPAAYLSTFARDLIVFDEVFVPSADLASTGDVAGLGLTDAAIARCAREGVLIVTEDFEMSQRLLRRGQYVLNFNHLRTYLIS